jgi:hypothetical protein
MSDYWDRLNQLGQEDFMRHALRKLKLKLKVQ